MTREEIEFGKVSCNNYIANRVLDIRKQTEHFEQKDFHNDIEEINKFLVKLEDTLENIKKYRDRLEIYLYEVPEVEADGEEVDVGYYNGY